MQTRALGTLAPSDRIRLGAAGLRTFFRLADAWGLAVADQCALLGDVGRSTHHAWRRQPPTTAESYTTDRLTRLSLLLGISALLDRLYGEMPAFARAWVTAPSAEPPFDGRAPLAVMRDEGLPGLLLVRRVLEARAGGGLLAEDEVAWHAPRLA